MPDDAVVAKQVGTAVERGWQVLAHVNGDAAIDQFVNAVAAAGPGRRPTVAIHAQTAREDQIDEFARLGILPSFFSMHTYYWGDWYRGTVLGEERAQDISPARWALDRGLRYTSHHDAPVALPNSIAVLSSQVTRRTRSGHLLGPPSGSPRWRRFARSPSTPPTSTASRTAKAVSRSASSRTWSS